jgi:hypothetical protein
MLGHTETKKAQMDAAVAVSAWITSGEFNQY